MTLTQKDFLTASLKELETRVPPPASCHHAITYARYGSDEAGWEDRLALQVNRDGKFHCFFLDDKDLNVDPYVLVQDVVDLLNEIDSKTFIVPTAV